MIRLCNPFSDTSYPSNKIGNGDGNNTEMTFPLHLIFTSVKGLPQVDYMYNKKHKIYYKCNTNWIVLLLYFWIASPHTLQELSHRFQNKLTPYMLKQRKMRRSICHACTKLGNINDTDPFTVGYYYTLLKWHQSYFSCLSTSQPQQQKLLLQQEEIYACTVQ